MFSAIKAWVLQYLVMILLVVAGLGWGWGGVQAYRISAMEKRAAQDQLKATQQARQKEAEWQLIYKETADAKDTQLRTVVAERDRFSDELRKRPARMPEAARPTCAGATGAELAAPDAGFLEGYGAFARSLQIELDACQKREAIDR